MTVIMFMVLFSNMYSRVLVLNLSLGLEQANLESKSGTYSNTKNI